MGKFLWRFNGRSGYHLGFVEVSRGVFRDYFFLVNPQARRDAKKKAAEQEQEKQRMLQEVKSAASFSFSPLFFRFFILLSSSFPPIEFAVPVIFVPRLFCACLALVFFFFNKRGGYV